jgi:hypothetical protein
MLGQSMFRFLRQRQRRRTAFFHEDDFCQQQLLPAAAVDFVKAELSTLAEFADAHRTPDGVGWTDMYLRADCPIELRTLQIRPEQFREVVSPILAPFEVVYTGYGGRRDLCSHTGAWGNSDRSILFADWDVEGIISNVWSSFFDAQDASVLAVSKAVGALARVHPIVYVDWAWGYVCDPVDEIAFGSLLYAKLHEIDRRMASTD